MKIATYTDPAKLPRRLPQEVHLYKLYCEHGELAVYNANAAFGTPGAAFAEPLKLKTLEGHVRYWKWCHLGRPIAHLLAFLAGLFGLGIIRGLSRPATTTTATTEPRVLRRRHQRRRLRPRLRRLNPKPTRSLTMKTLAFALALTTTLAFSPNAQAGEKLTPQERATGAVSILFYQKHCDTIPAKVSLAWPRS